MVRLKNRYMVVKIIPQQQQQRQKQEQHKTNTKIQFSETAITKTILKNVEKFYGDLGLGSIEHGLRIKYCNIETRIAIIRCRHRAHRFVTSVLPLITVIGDHIAKFQTLYVGATIMQCNKFLVNYQKNYLDKTVSKIHSAKERMDFVKNVLNFQVD